MLGSDSGLPLHTRAHTHLRPSWAGSRPTVRISHIKEPGGFGTAGLVVLFHKRQTSNELGMWSRAAFDTMLKRGLGCVTCMIYMCKKAVVVFFFSTLSEACPGSSTTIHVLYYSPKLYTTKQHHLQNCSIASDYSCRLLLCWCCMESISSRCVVTLWWMLYTSFEVRMLVWHCNITETSVMTQTLPRVSKVINEKTLINYATIVIAP